MAYKYPYIADKKLYAAVMFACKMIREDGFFNKAVERAADYYGVNEKDVAVEVRKRQSAGQKGKSLGKMKWFIICQNKGDVYRSAFSNFKIKRGKNAKTVTSQDMSYMAFIDMMENDTHDLIEVVGEYDSKKEAQENFKLATIEKFLQSRKEAEIYCCAYAKGGRKLCFDNKKRCFVEAVGDGQ